MKNYLFAPFKDDDEKIKSFNSLKNEIKGEDNSHYITTELVLFIGSLESYYDVIISKLQAEIKDEKYYCKEMISKLQAENEELKAELKKENGFSMRSIMVSKLKAENEKIKATNESLNSALITKQETIDTLIRDNDYDLDDLQAEKDELLEESNLLKAEIEKLNTECWCGCNDDLKAEYDEMKAEIKDLRKGCKLLKDTSHYPKEYKKEAEEYFDHNPQCKKLLFFILDGNDFDWDEDNDGCNGMNGEYNSILFADDCIAEFDNNTEGSD